MIGAQQRRRRQGFRQHHNVSLVGSQ